MERFIPFTAGVQSRLWKSRHFQLYFENHLAASKVGYVSFWRGIRKVAVSEALGLMS